MSPVLLVGNFVVFGPVLVLKQVVLRVAVPFKDQKLLLIDEPLSIVPPVQATYEVRAAREPKVSLRLSLAVCVHQERCRNRITVLYLYGVDFDWEVLREKVCHCEPNHLQALAWVRDVWLVGSEATRYDPDLINGKALFLSRPCHFTVVLSKQVDNLCNRLHVITLVENRRAYLQMRNGRWVKTPPIDSHTPLHNLSHTHILQI